MPKFLSDIIYVFFWYVYLAWDYSTTEKKKRANEKEKKWRRVDAARALGKLGDSAAVIPLLQVLQDDDSHLRVAAAEALGVVPGGPGKGPGADPGIGTGASPRPSSQVEGTLRNQLANHRKLRPGVILRHITRETHGRS